MDAGQICSSLSTRSQLVAGESRLLALYAARRTAMLRIKQSFVVLLSIVALISIATVLAPALTKGQGQSGGNQSPLNVNLVNTPLPIRDVENPARQPFFAEGSFTFGANDDSGIANLSPSVPSDKQAVLEYITTQCELPSGQRASLRISQVTNGAYVRDIAFPVLNFQATIPFGAVTRDIFNSSDPVRVYLPPSTEVILQAVRNPATSIGNCRVYVSGFLVNLV